MSARNNKRARHDDGITAPAIRTYGSRWTCWQQEDQECNNNSSTIASARSRRSSTTTGRQYGRSRRPEQPRSESLLKSQAEDRFALQSASALRINGVGGMFRSKGDEISHLVRQAGVGGEAGRTAAIALAKACKSSEMRKAIRAHGSILTDLTKALLASLRGGDGAGAGDGSEQWRIRDEAVVHCLMVAIFILSKDAAVANGFSPAIVSTLASLIENNTQSVAATATARDAKRGAATASLDGEASLLRGRARPQRDERRNHSIFDVDNEHDDGGGFGRDKDEGNDEDSDTPMDRTITSNDLRQNTELAIVLPYDATTTDHGSADVLVRARMLLDISDMIPWGMANRHLVSAADLALAALLNVAAQASPDISRDSGGGGCDDSIGDDFSTQESVLSKSQGSNVLGSLTDSSVADGETGGNANTNSSVIETLGRLGPNGFLFSVVVDGAAVLEALSIPEMNGSSGRGGVATDPSSLRLVHQLLLGLRLLDLITLNRSSADVARSASAGTPESPADSAGGVDALPSRTVELAGTLLLIVSRCQALVGDTGPSHSQQQGSPVAKKRRRGGVYAHRVGKKHLHQAKTQVLLGEEVTSRAHECMLAALRVLINVTHHDARVCAEVAARGGLGTLMWCLVVHSESPATAIKGSDCDVSSGGGRDSSVAERGRKGSVYSDTVNEEYNDYDMPRSALNSTKGDAWHRDRSSGSGTGGNAFDAQILALGALINCVELKESADNCAAMACLAVHPSLSFGSRAASNFGSATSLSSQCFAPEFLAKFLVECTRGFAKHLEADQREESDGEKEPMSPAHGDKNRGIGGEQATGHGDGSSALAAVAASAEGRGGSMSPAAAIVGGRGDGGEELMSAEEGTELVLGGHCALLLGLLVREEEKNRRLALPVLPDGSPTLIVRVLEAFMALQWQAGVLTEEVVLAVRELVEELEGMENEQAEEWNPFEMDDEDDPATASGITRLSTPASSPRKARKRPRSETTLPPATPFSTPPSGQWAKDLRGDGDEGDFALSGTGDSWRGVSLGRSPTSQRSLQAGAKGSPFPPSINRTKSPSTPGRWSTKSPSGATEQTTLPHQSNAAGDTDGRPPLGRFGTSPSYSLNTTPPRMRPGGLGIGGSTAGTRNWLGAPRPRTYGAPWKRHSRSIGGFRSSVYRDGVLRSRSGAGLGAARGSGVNAASSKGSVGKGDFDFDGEDSEEDTTRRFRQESTLHGGVGSKSGQSYLTYGGFASSSIFELASDGSDAESPEAKTGEKGGSLQADINEVRVNSLKSASVFEDKRTRKTPAALMTGRHPGDIIGDSDVSSLQAGRRTATSAAAAAAAAAAALPPLAVQKQRLPRSRLLGDGGGCRSRSPSPKPATSNAASLVEGRRPTVALSSLAAQKQRLPPRSRLLGNRGGCRSRSPSPKPASSNAASSLALGSGGVDPRSGGGGSRRVASRPIPAGKAGGNGKLGQQLVGTGKSSNPAPRAGVTGLGKRSSRSPSPPLPGTTGNRGGQQRARESQLSSLSRVRAGGRGVSAGQAGGCDRRMSTDVFDLPADDSD